MIAGRTSGEMGTPSVCHVLAVKLDTDISKSMWAKASRSTSGTGHFPSDYTKSSALASSPRRPSVIRLSDFFIA